MTTEPVVCEWYEPFVEPQLNHPEPVWERLREEQPVFFSPKVDAWIVTRYADSVEVLGDPARFSSSALSGSFGDRPADVQAILDEVPNPIEMDILANDPPRHTRLRRFMQRAFTPRHVAAMEDQVRAIADELIDDFIDDGTCDIYRQFAYPFPLLVVCGLLQIPKQLAPQLNTWATSSIAVRFGVFDDHEAHLAAARGRVEFYRYCESLIADRRSQPGHDLVSQLVRESDTSDDPLTNPELVHQVIAMVSAGHETSANWLTMTLYHLLEDRRRWEAIGDDRDLLATAVDEMLRFDSPVHAIWRTSVVETKVGGATIPGGSRVGVIVGSANRDEAMFSCPADMNMSRDNANRHLTFGRGIHFCVGAGLARQEGRIALQQLRTRLPSLRLRSSEGLRFRPNAVLRVPVGFRVEWDLPRAGSVPADTSA